MAKVSLFEDVLQRAAAAGRRAPGRGGGKPAAHRDARGSAQRAQVPTMPRLDWPVSQPYPVADRLIVLQNLAGIAPGSTSIGYRLEFSQGRGILLGWNGSAANQTDQVLARSSLKVRLSWNGNEEVVTNGQSGDYVRFSDVFTTGFPYAPLMVEVGREDKATILFQNDHTANTYTPSLCFFFWDLESGKKVRIS